MVIAIVHVHKSYKKLRTGLELCWTAGFWFTQVLKLFEYVLLETIQLQSESESDPRNMVRRE